MSVGATLLPPSCRQSIEDVTLALIGETGLEIEHWPRAATQQRATGNLHRATNIAAS